MYEFTLIEYGELDESEFCQYSRKPIFTSKQWIDYIIEDSKAEPAIFRISRDKHFVGYAPFLFVKKFGVKIAGSPFRGWSTCWMGIEIENVSEKIPVLRELTKYLFEKYHCLYCEIVDRDITEEQVKKSGYQYSLFETLELNISRTDEELWKVFKTDCRNFIRQFERRGAILQQAEPTEQFADEYYEQLKDVFGKQGMAPTYSCEKVKRLLKHMKRENVLCLRVVTPDGHPAATSIFFADQTKFYFWGGASYRKYQHYRPNEYMIWYAIQYWRERGIQTFDMVGNRKYKQKFGAQVASYPYIKIAKYKFLIDLRDFAEMIYFKMLKLKRKKCPGEAEQNGNKENNG